MMKRLASLVFVTLACCTTINTTSDTSASYPGRGKTGVPTVEEGRQLAGPPHPGRPCDATCRHYCFAGQWFTSHLHSQGCGHVLDEALHRWTLQ